MGSDRVSISEESANSVTPFSPDVIASDIHSLARVSSIRYREEECFPNQDAASIKLHRIQTVNTILETLEDRLLDIANDEQTDKALEAASLYEAEGFENGLPTKNDGSEFAQVDPELVTWEGEDDPENPVNWTPNQKYLVTALVSMYAFASPFASSILSPAVKAIAEDFGESNTVTDSLMVSIFLLAFAIGPLLISAPLSEMYGRKIVMDLSCWFMLVFNIGCAFSKTPTQMIVCRFFAGLGGATPLSIGAGSLSDMFYGPGPYGAKRRGMAMALFSIGPSVGPSTSTMIAGYIVERAGWRWLFYVMCIFNFCLALFGTFFFRETYAPTLLLRKKNRLVKETGNKNLKTIYEIADLETSWGRFEVNITRPITLLFTHPMVFGLGLFMAVCYGCLYILVVAFPHVWVGVYHYSLGNSGLLYISFLIGYLGGILVWGKLVDYIYESLTVKNGGVSKPEYRLPCLLASGLLLGVGLFWFGWGVDITHRKNHMMWVFPEVGACMFAFGVIAMFQTIQNYLVDMNPRFAASSIAAAAFFRSLFGFAFPLFATQMFQRLGYGVGCSIFGAIALLTGIPFPLFLLYKGEGLRNWANKRMEKARAKRDAKNLERIRQENLALQRDLTSEKSNY